MLHILGNVSVLIDRKTLVTVNIELIHPSTVYTSLIHLCDRTDKLYYVGLRIWRELSLRLAFHFSTKCGFD